MNDLTITATIKIAPRVISDKFATAFIRVPSEKSAAFIELAAAHDAAKTLGELVEGQELTATGNLRSKLGTDNKWRLSFFANTVEPGEVPATA